MFCLYKLWGGRWLGEWLGGPGQLRHHPGHNYGVRDIIAPPLAG